VNYLTKCTDYLANEKIESKDIAIVKEFIEPLKWDYMDVYKVRLG